MKSEIIIAYIKIHWQYLENEAWFGFTAQRVRNLKRFNSVPFSDW